MNNKNFYTYNTVRIFYNVTQYLINFTLGIQYLDYRI